MNQGKSQGSSLSRKETQWLNGVKKYDTQNLYSMLTINLWEYAGFEKVNNHNVLQFWIINILTYRIDCTWAVVNAGLKLLY